MDRRLTPATARMAHVSLRGQVDAPAFTDGVARRLAVPVANLLRHPGGPRDRQLLLGDGFTVIDRDQGHSFGFAEKDGYCGWLPDEALSSDGRPDDPAPTHWVSAPATHLYPEPRVQAAESASLSLGARVTVIAVTDAWAQTPLGFLPARHLRPLGDWARDPVGVAATLLGTPYLWGGNSRAGLDCSGLVQLAFHASGLPCPGDSDLQQTMGQPVVDAACQRGDLLFWRGHVALVSDADTILHANGHSMSVAYEPIAVAVSRIAAQHGGPVVGHRRPSLLGDA